VNFTIIGILAVLVFTLVTLPALLSILEVVEGAEQGEANYEASIFNRTLLALGRLGVTRPYLVFYLFLAANLVLGFGIAQLHFSHNQLHYFTEDSDFMRQVRLIEAQAGGFRALEVLIDTQRERGIIDHDLLQTIEQLDTHLRSETDIQGRAYIGRTRSLVDIFKEISCATTGRDQNPCPIPKDEPALAEQFDHIGRIVPEMLRKYTDADLRLGRLTAMMYWRDAADDVDFIARVREYAATLFDDRVKVAVTGIATINSGIIHAMMTSLAIGYSTGILLIAALMILAVGEVRLGLLAMIPNLSPIVIGLGVMGLLAAFLADVLLAPALLRIFYGTGQRVPLKRSDVPRTQSV